MDPKMCPTFASTIRILLKSESEAHFWVHFWSPKLGPKSEQKKQKNEGKHTKKLAQGNRKGPHKRKPGHLEITILWVRILACFPNSCFHVSVKVRTHLAPKANICGCDHGKEKARVVILCMHSHNHKQQLLAKLTCKKPD